MKALVIGGAGFIGSHVVENLVKKGHEVSVYDNMSRANVEKNLSYLKEALPDVEIITGDILEFEKLKEAVSGKDAVFHTAAQVAVTTSMKDPRKDFRINAEGSFNVLEAARLGGKPTVVYCSTNKVYGDNVNGVPVEEGEKRYDFSGDLKGKGIPTDFSIDAKEHSPYGCSKLVGDVYMQDYAHVFDVPTVVNRMSCIYGTRQWGNEDQGWVVHFAFTYAKNNTLNIFGDGKQIRDILWGDDLAELFIAQAENIDKVKGEVFNIGGGPNNTISLIELMEQLTELKGSDVEKKYFDWRPADQKVYYSDISKAEKMLGWAPKVTAKEGVKKLYEWVEGVI